MDKLLKQLESLLYTLYNSLFTYFYLLLDKQNESRKPIYSTFFYMQQPLNILFQNTYIRHSLIYHL